MVKMSNDKTIRARVKCCFCGGSLENSKHVNVVCLMKEARWRFPVWGNVLLGVTSFASAILCDKCVEEKKEPKFAVEWTQNLTVVKYHSVEELKDVPEEIFQPLDDLEPGRHGVAG